VLAIRALELLRASLLEVVLPTPAEKTQTAKAPTDVVKWVEPTLPEPAPEQGELLDGFALGAGVQALHGLDGIGLAIGPTLRAFHGIASHGFGRLVLAGPLASPTLSEPEGSAAVRQEFVSLDLGWATSADPLGALVWAGAGGYHLHTTGTAVPPYRSTSDDVLSVFLSAGIGGVARLGQNLALTARPASSASSRDRSWSSRGATPAVPARLRSVSLSTCWSPYEPITQRPSRRAAFPRRARRLRYSEGDGDRRCGRAGRQPRRGGH
jgi:hypothetical protein